jgi:uncharacterized protein YoxC
MKKNSESTGSKKTDTNRETRVLLERMHSDIQRIAEAQSSTGTQIAEIKAIVNDLLPLKSEVKTIYVAVMQLSGDLKELKTDGKGLKNKVDENLSNYEKRITKLEEKVLA